MVMYVVVNHCFSIVLGCCNRCSSGNGIAADQKVRGLVSAHIIPVCVDVIDWLYLFVVWMNYVIVHCACSRSYDCVELTSS